MDNISRKIEIGKNLIEVKQAIGHGNWLPWLDAEFDESSRNAYRYINFFETFKDKSLPHAANIGKLSQKVLFELGAPSTPEEVRQEAIEMAESGETPTAKEVKELKAKNKELNDLIQQQSEVGYSFGLKRS